MMDVAGILARAKEALEVTQDQELAAHLGINRATLASWRRRQSIPAKYLSEMLDGGRVSLDWLVTGRGQQFLTDHLGLSQIDGMQTVDDAIDRTILWIALLCVVNELESDKSSNLYKLGKMLSNRHSLSYVHLYLEAFINRITHSQKKWEESGLVSDDNIYRALMTEFRAGGSFENPIPPWWEDESIV